MAYYLFGTKAWSKSARNYHWYIAQLNIHWELNASNVWISHCQLLWDSGTVSGPVKSVQWRHNDHDGVSNHQPHVCLLNRLFRRRSKKTSKLHVTGLCAGNAPGPVNSLHKGPVTRKMFPFDDVIMYNFYWCSSLQCALKFLSNVIKYLASPGHQQPWYWPNSRITTGK